MFEHLRSLCTKNMKPVRVAVIGAGAAGLAALRHLTARPDVFEAVAYEQTGAVGGTWVYSEKTGADEYGLPIHSSMYKNMKTNLPKEIMAFPDFPFKKSLPSFVGHQDVHRYLEEYTNHYSLSKYIQFFTHVEQVKPRQSPTGGTLWDVTSKPLSQPASSLQSREFDAVMVCNGHYSVPMIPELPGLDTFEGQVMHSHNYRHPEDFTGKRVIVLGAGPSGVDMSLEIAQFATQVTLSHNKQPMTAPLPGNVGQSAGISSIKPKSVILNDGEELEVDSILMCTGYKYSFPFLTPESTVGIADGHMTPLYKHFLHTTYPSMCFVGIVHQVCPFPLFYSQIKLFVSILDGSIKLPSKAEMDADSDKDFNERLQSGLPIRYAHKMGVRQWEYNDNLADIGQFDRLCPVIQTLYNAVHDRRHEAVMDYKKDNFELEDEKSFKVMFSHNRTPLTSPLPENMIQSTGISSIKSNCVILRDGRDAEVDFILLCTGYKFSFPFLSQECAPVNKDGRLTPLYKHLIHTVYPSICIVGICHLICPFPFFHNQVQFFTSVLDKSILLPSKEIMDLDSEKDFKERLGSGMPKRYAHKMGERQWTYNNSLAHMGKFGKFPPVIRNIYEAVFERRFENIMECKKDNYHILDEYSYRVH